VPGPVATGRSGTICAGVARRRNEARVRVPAHRSNLLTKKAPVNRSLLLPLICVKRVLRELQDLPCVAGGLPVNPLNGSRLCLASRLWSSQIFCDSATEVS